MGFGRFVEKNLAPAAVAGGGAMIAMWGFASDIWSIWTAGLRPGVLQMIGFVTFVVGVVSVLYRQHQLLDERLGTDAHSHAALRAAAPVPISSSPSRRERKTAAPPTVSEKAASPTPREFLDKSITPEFLLEITADQTDLQAKRAIAPYVGKWIAAEGLVADVAAVANVHLVQIGKERLRTIWPNCALTFENDAGGRLHNLKRGQKIRAVGRFEGLSGRSIVSVGQSELLDD
jgi:hypothetical protein